MVSLYRQMAYKAWILRSKEQQGTSWSHGDAYVALRVLPGMVNEDAYLVGYAWIWVMELEL